jgi:hypothetical protein
MWDNLQKRKKIGPRQCFPCQGSDESIYHLICEYPYAIQVWKEIDQLACIDQAWNENSLQEHLKI